MQESILVGRIFTTEQQNIMGDSYVSLAATNHKNKKNMDASNRSSPSKNPNHTLQDKIYDGAATTTLHLPSPNNSKPARDPFSLNSNPMDNQLSSNPNPPVDKRKRPNLQRWHKEE